MLNEYKLDLMDKIGLNNEQKQKLFIFNIDRGGTFTDFYVQQISFLEDQSKQKDDSESFIIKNEHVFKFPSQSSFGQGPIVGIRNFLTSQNLMEKDQWKIPTKNIFRINLGTTIATNALLQRKGSKNCMIVTKGFKNMLTMRHLARPDIFDLKCERQLPLFTEVMEADERVFLNEPPPEFQAGHLNTKTSDMSLYRKKLTEHEINRICQQIKQKGYQSVGISFCHSIVDKQNQCLLKQALQKQNVHYIEEGSSIEELGYLKRSQTTNLNVFLGPIMKTYFEKFTQNFDESQKDEKLELKIMKSNGGFSVSQNVKPSQILFSGPAGGLIGYSSMMETFSQISNTKITNLIGLDMGGTSTDISRVENGQFSILQSTQIESVFVCSPHLEIDTIAAGGGSKLYYENGMFKVGPESVGSKPGPVCYGYGNQLALTDANFLLNRIDSTYFPKIFGPDNNQGLNFELTKKAFDKLSQKINESSEQNNFQKKSPEQIAEGFIAVANELMARSVRRFFTFGTPDALCIFGSAGGQHCCQLAQKLDITHLFIHRFSGVLSAYGLSKSPQSLQKKYYLGDRVTRENFNSQLFTEKIIKIKQQNQSQSLNHYDEVKLFVMIGYVGTNYQITIQLGGNLLGQFEKLHMKDNGFVLPGKEYRIEYLIVKYLKYPPKYIKEKQLVQRQQINDFLVKKDKVFLNNEWKVVPFYDINEIKKSSTKGPAMFISKTVTLLVKQHWTAFIQDDCIYLKKQSNPKSNEQKISDNNNHAYDPITLTLYSTRLMSIAEQMGKVLQRISISTNIKQRLDFSCGIFDWNGKVLANAPHIPVHLGSMETAVKEQIKRGIKSGQSILTNHPVAGGSHLPDLTVVTCVEIEKEFRIFVASRGHHADIGGISPGSMPPFSKYLNQEGLAVQKFLLTSANGHFRQHQTRQLFSQSRRVDDNISDLLAQVAANKIGIKLLLQFIHQQTIQRFKSYVGYICDNAASCVEKLLVDFSVEKGMQEVDSVEDVEYMDDGTEIRLKLTIDRLGKKAVFDFTGTGGEVFANTNAPESISRSAIIYSLRSLIARPIPLNSGCLQPISIIIPPSTILSPSKNSAVVGGNVETSQRIVDLILKPFGVVAASQGTMNNFLFGNEKVSYYETIGGGSGAGRDFHGKTGQVHMTNTRITDVEHLEHKYPVILKNFRIRQHSGGRGKFYGGDGVIRQFIFLEPLQVSILSERRVFHPYGLYGGESGKRGKNIFVKYSEEERVQRNLGSKNVVNVERFDVIKIQTPGGGGYGKAQ